MCKRISAEDGHMALYIYRERERERESSSLYFSFSCFLRTSENHGGPVRCVCVCVELVSSSTEKIQGISSPELWASRKVD